MSDQQIHALPANKAIYELGQKAAKAIIEPTVGTRMGRVAVMELDGCAVVFGAFGILGLIDSDKSYPDRRYIEFYFASTSELQASYSYLEREGSKIDRKSVQSPQDAYDLLTRRNIPERLQDFLEGKTKPEIQIVSLGISENSLASLIGRQASETSGAGIGLIGLAFGPEAIAQAKQAGMPRGGYMDYWQRMAERGAPLPGAVPT